MTFTAPGSCVIDATAAGDGTYSATTATQWVTATDYGLQPPPVSPPTGPTPGCSTPPGQPGPGRWVSEIDIDSGRAVRTVTSDAFTCPAAIAANAAHVWVANLAGN